MAQNNKIVSIKESLISVLDYLENHAKEPVDDTFNKDFMQIGKSDLYLHKQNLVILTGQNFSGKTSLALSIVWKLAVEKNKVMAFISCCGLNTLSITLRMLAQKAEVSLSKLHIGLLKIDDVEKIQTASENLFEAPIFLNEFSDSAVTYKDLEVEIENMVKNYNVETVFINSLDCIKEISNQNECEMLFKKLKELAGKLNIAIVLISPLDFFEETIFFDLKKIVRNDDVDMLLVLNREFNRDENVKVQPCNLSVEKDDVFGVRDIALSFTLNSAKFEFETEKHNLKKVKNVFLRKAMELIERVNNIAKKVKEEDRDKAFELINESIGNTDIETLTELEIADYEYIFSDDEEEVCYLEFDSAKDASLYFSKQNAIKGIVLLLSSVEEITMDVVAEAVKTILVNTPQDEYEFYWSQVCKTNAKFMRILVQFK